MIKIPISINELNSYFQAMTEIKELKIGGQKAVYTANHKIFGAVVLKLIPDDTQDQRILREIEIVRLNKFPNVPVIYEVGKIETSIGNFLHIIEQRIFGEDLRSLIELQGKLSFPVVIKFLESLLATVVELEKKNIVHRDIKPDNILYETEKCFWLIDFGIARDMDKVSLTATNAHFGPFSAGYAPPEQFQNMKRLIDSRADLFAIGVTAYEMLHGKNPFLTGARGAIDVLMRTATLVEDPLKITEDTHNELSAFIKTLMQKNPTFRPPSAAMALLWFREITKTLTLEATP